MLSDFRWRECLGMALAHHPDCHHCSQDVFRIGPTRVCVGCLTMYPTVLVSLLLVLAVGEATSSWSWLGAGILLGSVQLVSVVGRARRRTSKALVKFCAGAGLAMAGYGLATLPVPLSWRMGGAALALALACVSFVPKARRMAVTCRPCLEAWSQKVFARA